MGTFLTNSLVASAVLARGGVATTYTYNGHRNHQLGTKHAAKLWGAHRIQTKNTQETVEESFPASRKLRQRRTEGEIPTPPPFSDSFDEVPSSPALGSSDDGAVGETAGEQDREQQSFFTAESLDFFRKGIDPANFEWVNPDEVAAGAWTCGFMKPSLGTTPGLAFPTVEVYICIRFANKQPAVKGNIFTHCGGPGSASLCTIIGDLDQDAWNSYNFITIDQRGIGRSYPSFGHEACLSSTLIRAENGTIVGREYPEDAQNWPDFSNVESIKAGLEPQKRQTLSCWTCDDCGFQLSAEQEDGSTNKYHFLEYSGSRQLAEDIERFRLLINAPLMHIYGVSYGTQVFGTYATLFPSSVGLMVLDGNVNPYQNLETIAHDQATGENTRIAYGLYSCSARNIENPGSCPVDDLPGCVSDINAVLSQDFGIQAGLGARNVIALILQLMQAIPDRAQEICDLAANGQGEELDSLVSELEEQLSPDNTAETRQSVYEMTSFEINSESGPTYTSDNAFGPIYGNPEYFELFTDGIPLVTVNAQDAFSALYDADYFARRVKQFGELYTGAGTGSPVRTFFSEWSAGFNWPKGVPLSPMGNPLLTGIISGQLFDLNTPYVWTQNMRQNFKYASLLTSQYFNHGLSGNDDSCQQHIVDYFRQGFVDFVDGTVCGTDFGDDSLLSAC